MATTFRVCTGIASFRIEVDTGRAAIAELKRRIQERASKHRDPDIGMSLVQAHHAGTLNYLVFDDSMRTMICGELSGVYQEPVTRALADKFPRFLSDAIYYRHFGRFLPKQ